MARVRILGLALSLFAGASAAGCVSDERAMLRDMAQASLIDAVNGTEAPRQARMQQGPPLSERPPVPPIAPPPPLRPAQPIAPPPPVTTAQPVNYRPTDPRDLPRVIVRARVNGKPIFEDDVYMSILPDLARLGNVRGPERAEKEAELRAKGLDALIDNEVIYQEAIRKLVQVKMLDKIKEFAQKEFQKTVRATKEQQKWSDADLSAMLKRQGMTLELWQEQDEKKFIRNSYMENRVVPPVKHRVGVIEIREYYDQHRNEFQQVDKVTWQNIFISAQKHGGLDQARGGAREVLRRWRAGEDFKSLLAYHDGPAQTGEGQGTRRGEIRPAQAEDMLFSLRKDQFGPPLEIQTGIHLYRVIDREYAGPISFNEEVQKTIRRKLQNEIAQREERRIVQELRERAVIEINP